MTEYIMLVIIMIFIYFVLIRNKPAPKTDWETLPTLPEYQKIKKSSNEQGDICCQYCASTEIIKRSLKSKQENPDKTKFYNVCTACNVILWRSQTD